MTVNILDVYGKPLETPADLLILGYMSESLIDRGIEPDFEGLEFDFKTSTKVALHRLFLLEKAGRIVTGLDWDVTPTSFFDSWNSSYDLMKGSLNWVSGDGETLQWVLDDIEDPHLSHRVESYLVGYFAEYIVARYLEEVDLPLVIQVGAGNKVANHRELFYLYQHHPVLREFVKLNLPEFFLGGLTARDRSLEIEYQSLLYSTESVGKFHNTIPSDKVKRLEEEGFKPGGVYVLWYKDRITNNNPGGEIQTGNLVRLDAVSDRGIVLTFIPQHHTVEQLYAEFTELGDVVNEGFSDILELKPTRKETFEFYDLAVGTVFGEEHHMLTLLDKGAVHTMYMVEGSVIRKRTLTDPEFAFYILLQNKVDFNTEVFLENYSLDPEWLELFSVDFDRVRELILSGDFPVIP